MSDLKLASIGDLVDIFNNIRIPLSSKQREHLEKKYPYYGAQGIVDYVNDYLFDGEYILVAEDGENLRSNSQNICNLVVGKFWVNNHAHIIKANTNNNTKYLFYNFNRIYFEPHITGSAQPKLNKENLLAIKTYVHQKENQERIAAVLSALDDKIELNNKINAELEQTAKTLYDYWFVQFDFPNTKGKPYKSSGGKMVYNEVLKREVPEGWEVKKLGDVLKTHLGGTPSTANEKFWDGNIPWMNSGEVANFPLLATEQSITEEAIKKSSTKLMKKGSVLLSITRHLRVNILGIDACINQSIAGIEENNLFKNSYIYFSILNDIERLMSLRTGAQQPHINKEIVDSSPFIVVSKEILEKYYKTANPILDRIINNANQNQQIAALRDWLLPMLMNGQAKVGEVPATLSQEDYAIPIAAESKVGYKKKASVRLNQDENQDARFELWLSSQGLAARGEIDTTTLRAIFDAMDDEDK